MLLEMASIPSHALAHAHVSSRRKQKQLKNTKEIDALAYVVGIGGNAATFPQIGRVWSGAAPGVAVSTWLMFTGIGVIWLVYAVKHGQKPLIVAQIAGFSCNIAIVVGWMLHN